MCITQAVPKRLCLLPSQKQTKTMPPGGQIITQAKKCNPKEFFNSNTFNSFLFLIPSVSCVLFFSVTPKKLVCRVHLGVHNHRQKMYPKEFLIQIFLILFYF
jgi:hypothetical protein